MTKSVTEWIDDTEEWQRVLLRELRSIIQTAAPDAAEALKWGQPCYSRNSLFCYLQRAKQHVTLGFQKGAQMNDPNGVLQGSGKTMRHLRFERNADIDEAQCTALVMEALRLD